MRKVKAAINMTLDGYCDHTAVTPDEEIHQHFADALDGAGVILYGRITYQLMLFWKKLIDQPSGEKSMDDFAIAIDRIPKIVFSRTMKETEWGSASLATKPLEEYVKELKQQTGGDILIGCRSLIVQLLEARLIDELQICLHPVIAGDGLPLFENLSERKEFNLVESKSFASGAVALYYQPTN